MEKLSISTHTLLEIGSCLCSAGVVPGWSWTQGNPPRAWATTVQYVYVLQISLVLFFFFLNGQTRGKDLSGSFAERIKVTVSNNLQSFPPKSGSGKRNNAFPTETFFPRCLWQLRCGSPGPAAPVSLFRVLGMLSLQEAEDNRTRKKQLLSSTACTVQDGGKEA